MYETHFGFNARPFAATPNADRFFPSECTQRAFDAVVSCVERASGAALVVGSSGLGKSLLLQVIGRHFQQSFSVAILESASLNSRRELLQCILFELGLPYRGMEEGELRLTLMDYLKPSDRCPNGLLLCVDEAHLLPTQLLEEMRMITNLVREGQPRARLVLVGNAKIEERLADPKLESLSQRISTRAYLEPMNSTECREYVAANVNAVGANASDIFNDESLEAIYIATHGIPRLVNQVCDHALVLATANGQTCVTKELINEAWSDIQRLPVEWHVLGTQSDSKNEHVIEFGSLDDSAMDSQLETSMENPSTDENHSEDADREPTEYELAPVDDVNGEGVTTKEVTPEETAEEEVSEQAFVFDGPSNPFSEKFSEEELIVDTFSQVIGHSPQRPAFPQAKSESAPPVSIDMDMTNETSDSADESGNDRENSAHAEATRKTSSNATTEPEHTDSTDEQTSQTLDEFLAQSSDAITFGVGQGIYESSFTPVQSGEISTTQSPSGADSGADSDSCSDQPNQSESLTLNTESSIANLNPVSDGTVAKDESVDSVAETEDLQHDDAYGADSEQHQIEERINEAVADLREDLTRAAGTETDKNIQSVDQQDPTDTHADQMTLHDTSERAADEQASDEQASDERAKDDRDMIIVQEEPQQNSVDTVPIHEAQTTEPSTQAKREDYQQLFDRLRNG